MLTAERNASVGARTVRKKLGSPKLLYALFSKVVPIVSIWELKAGQQVTAPGTAMEPARDAIAVEPVAASDRRDTDRDGVDQRHHCITYELTMLSAILATLVTVLASARLPERGSRFYDPAVSTGKILVGVTNLRGHSREELRRRLKIGGQRGERDQHLSQRAPFLPPPVAKLREELFAHIRRNLVRREPA